MAIQPRIIRMKFAPDYCGMNERVFNSKIRPFLMIVPIGERGVGFDRFELDRALDDYISRYGLAPSRSLEQNRCKNEKRPSKGSPSRMEVGGSTSRSTVSDFEEIAKRINSKT